jgi:hypothetical protein
VSSLKNNTYMIKISLTGYKSASPKRVYLNYFV